MKLSLSFLSQVLVKAAIEGRLSRGFGVKRLMDLRWAGRTNGPRSVSKRPRRLDRNSIGSPIAVAHASHSEIGAAFRSPTLIASRCPTSADLGNGIWRPETRRRVHPREAGRPAKWPSQTALGHANAL
jgi:hypothetical protein